MDIDVCAMSRVLNRITCTDEFWFYEPSQHNTLQRRDGHKHCDNNCAQMYKKKM